MTQPAKPLRLGFASIYAWRPHVEHLYFLATLAQQAGHHCHFLTCDGDLPTCYTRELRDIRPHWQECMACRLGGIRSYASFGITSIGRMPAHAATVHADAWAWSQSSASTLGRFESDADFASTAFLDLAARLEPATRRSYAAARSWIEKEALDAICVFNGRIDATRAIFEAAHDAGIRVVSLERTWFGDGLQLLPDENCLGLRSVDRLVRNWRDFPLTETQALKAASYAAARFLRRNHTEWRAYNTQACAGNWPVFAARRRILLLPSSRNEFWGHPDWRSGWSEPVRAYDALIDHFGLQANDLVLRCHPNWAEKIGKKDGHLPEQYFTQWAQARGIHTIASTDPISTLGLIEQCEAIVVSSGSAALEASLLGKQVIGTDPSIYQQANLSSDATSTEALVRLRLNVDLPLAEQSIAAQHLVRMGLRFCYTVTNRIAQFADFVKARSAADYEYLEGADPQRFVDLLTSGFLQADDETYAEDNTGEDQVIALVNAREWNTVMQFTTTYPQKPHQSIHRRWWLRPLDSIRKHMPVGDR